MKATLILVLTILLWHSAAGQRLWSLYLTDQDYINIGADSSETELKALLRGRDPLRQTSAMLFLALRAGEAERSFLLDSLHVDATPRGVVFDWAYYFSYQLVRGYYGDQRAIAGLDTVVRFGPRGLRITAESWLVAAQQFLHYELLKQALADPFERPSAVTNLAAYGTQPTYKAEVRNLLTGIVRDSVWGELVWRGIKGLAEIDKSSLISLLDERFRNSSSALRYNLFLELGNQDAENQPERTMWAVPREPDIARRNNYLPRYAAIAKDSAFSRKYLLPAYVKFITDWGKTETSKLVLSNIRNFIQEFEPPRPSLSTPISALIDSLNSLCGQGYNYGWIGDANFIKDLGNGLENAQKHLAKGDSVNTSKEIQKFQDKVNREYEKSVDDERKGKSRDKRFVTIQGWKFLNYNAQFILDRLPTKK